MATVAQKLFVKFSCQVCASRLEVASEFVGKKGRCPKCSQVITIAEEFASYGPVELEPEATAEETPRDRRMAERFPVSQAELRFCASDTISSLRCTGAKIGLADLSAGGAAFTITGVKERGQLEYFRPYLSAGKELRFSLDLPAFLKPFDVKGRVKRIERLKAGDGVRVALEFREVGKSLALALSKLQENRSLRNIKRMAMAY